MFHSLQILQIDNRHKILLSSLLRANATLFVVLACRKEIEIASVALHRCLVLSMLARDSLTGPLCVHMLGKRRL